MCISIYQERTKLCEFVYLISLNVIRLILDSYIAKTMLDNLSLSDSGEGTIIMVSIEKLVE